MTLKERGIPLHILPKSRATPVCHGISTRRPAVPVTGRGSPENLVVLAGLNDLGGSLAMSNLDNTIEAMKPRVTLLHLDAIMGTMNQRDTIHHLDTIVEPMTTRGQMLRLDEGTGAVCHQTTMYSLDTILGAMEKPRKGEIDFALSKNSLGDMTWWTWRIVISTDRVELDPGGTGAIAPHMNPGIMTEKRSSMSEANSNGTLMTRNANVEPEKGRCWTNKTSLRTWRMPHSIARPIALKGRTIFDEDVPGMGYLCRPRIDLPRPPGVSDL